MTSQKLIALIETDQAVLASADQAIKDLQAIAVVLCHQRYSVELAERLQEDIQTVEAGLQVIRRWMAQMKNVKCADCPFGRRRGDV